MKTTGILIFFLFATIVLTAQQISNLNFETVGKNIQIRYDLDGKMNELYDVTLFASQNEGSWEGPLHVVSGDVGENIGAGNGKLIVWDVLKEKDKLTGNQRFKIEVSPTVISDCNPFKISHNAGSVAPVTKTVTYGTVLSGLSGSQKCWITQNLGADHQATSATDISDASAGWYWQFNQKQGFKHDGTPKTNWNSSINENSDWLSDNDICALLLDNRWRLPTKTEWETADTTGGWDNYNKTFSSVLKLQAAGYLNYSDGSLYRRGSRGYYWSSSSYSSDYGWYLTFNSGNCNMSKFYRKTNGFTVRCLRN